MKSCTICGTRCRGESASERRENKNNLQCLPEKPTDADPAHTCHISALSPLTEDAEGAPMHSGTYYISCTFDLSIQLYTLFTHFVYLPSWRCKRLIWSSGVYVYLHVDRGSDIRHCHGSSMAEMLM